MAGINHYIFLSAVILGLGIYAVVSHKNIFRILAGLVLIFTASAINIAALTGISNYNAEGQIILYLTVFIVIMTLFIGAIMFYNNYKQTGSPETDFND